MRFSRVPFQIILIDPEWLSKIFNETKHRAVSLQQLSFCCKKYWNDAEIKQFLSEPNAVQKLSIFERPIH